jgi:ABC-2 type transport system permease protein
MTAAANALVKIRGFKVPNWGKIPALLRREFLDSKTSFFHLPLIVIGLTLAVLVMLMVSFEVRYGDQVNLDLQNFSITVDGKVMAHNGHFADTLDQEDQGKFAQIFSRAVSGGNSVGLLMILPFVVFFGLLGALYDDRKDRSYLFWKSMPVSDTREVLAKFGFYTLAGPAMFFFYMMVAGIGAMILVTPFIWLHNGSAMDLLWGPAPFISMWFATAATYVVYALWILPILAWLLLASAYAPKAPMIWAVVPIVAIIATEAIFNDGQTYLGNALLDRIALDFGHIMQPIFEHKQNFKGDFEINDLTLGDAGRALLATLASAKFWAGQIFTAGFVAGAIYLRRYRV